MLPIVNMWAAIAFSKSTCSALDTFDPGDHARYHASTFVIRHPPNAIYLSQYLLKNEIPGGGLKNEVKRAQRMNLDIIYASIWTLRIMLWHARSVHQHFIWFIYSLVIDAKQSHSVIFHYFK